MERSPNNYDKAGRFLTAQDINRMEEQIFTPAIMLCNEQGFRDKNGTYYMNLPANITIEDGVECIPRFESAMDSQTGVCTHDVAQDVIESRTFNQLTDDERELIRSEFLQRYRQEGGDEANLSDDAEWQALVDSKQHKDVTIRYSATTKYVFTDTTARRNFYIMHTMIKKGEALRVLKDHSFEYDSDIATFDNTAASILSGFSPEETAIIDIAQEDLCAVTTADLPEIMEIMTSLGLVTRKDQKHFVNGV
jgi:hypothetical protein